MMIQMPHLDKMFCVVYLNLIIILQFGIVTEVMNNGDLHKYLGALHPR